MKSTEKKLTEFQNHQLGCSQRQAVILSETRTLVNCCLVGAPLLRDDLNATASKAVRRVNKALKEQFEDNTKTTKKKAKSATRYVQSSILL